MSGTFARHLCILSQPLDRIPTKIEFSFSFFFLILPPTEHTVSEDEFDNPRSKNSDYSASRRKKRMPVASSFAHSSLYGEHGMVPFLPWALSCLKIDRLGKTLKK
ncbi:hypothetical protein TNCV_3018121 [Trichonephila clavipes]|nr:hypothetical protein TNCV_3018121 [Trichonephila clavipes]